MGIYFKFLIPLSLILTAATLAYSQTGTGNIPISQEINKTKLSQLALPIGNPESLPQREIQEINRLKSGYDSHSLQIKELKKSRQDSAAYDSLFVQLKVKSGELVDREMHVLEELKHSVFSGSSDISGAISYTQRNLVASKESLANAPDLDILGDILQTNEENLKALVNEYVFPSMDKMAPEMPSQIPSVGKPSFTDYYSQGGLEALSQGADIASVKASLEDRTKSITPEMLESYGKDFTKLELLEDGTVKVIQSILQIHHNPQIILHPHSKFIWKKPNFFY